MGLSRAPLGVLLDPLGTILRSQKAIGSEKGEKATINDFTQVLDGFGLLGGVLGMPAALLDSFSSDLGASCRMPGSILSHLESAWAILEVTLYPARNNHYVTLLVLHTCIQFQSYFFGACAAAALLTF